MVKQIALILTLVSISSCGFVRSVWNAEPPKRKNIVVSGSELPAFNRIFSKNDADATQVLKEWKTSVTASFNQIEGAKKNYISSREIRSLVVNGFVKIDPDTEVSVEKVQSILEIMGFKDGISADNVDSLFNWLDDNRAQARLFYETFLMSDPNKGSWSSGDLIDFINFSGSLLTLTGNEPIEPGHLTELLNPWIPEKYPHAKNGLRTGLNLTINFFASFCGDRVDQSNWNGRRIGMCLNSLTKHFQGSAAAFDYMFGKSNPTKNREALSASATELPNQVSSWLKDHHHPAFQTEHVKDLAKAIDIPPPYAFVDLTSWIPKFNVASTPEKFDPTFFIDFSEAMKAWILTSVAVTANDHCEDLNWKNCAFNGTYEPVDQLFSEEYASLIRAKDLGFVRKIALYDSLSQFIMAKFDIDKTGILDENIKELINIVIRLLDSNSFAQNVISRAMERPFDPSNTKDSLQSIERQGLSELVAFASEIVPQRAMDRRSFIRKLQSQVTRKEKKIPYTLDQLGITSFLYLYDLIENLRDDYLNHYALPIQISGPLTYVKRRDAVKMLPRILHDHFPLIYNECLKEGFERTCGVVYTQVLPNAPDGTDVIESYELDVVTLTSIVLESMMHRCDRNGDDALSSNPFDGYDEKHCMITVSTALAKRLINANIVKQNDTADLLMKLIEKAPFVRWAAKAALTRGTSKNLWFFGLPPFSLLSGPATLGSVLSLAAEFIDSDKVKAIENDTIGPITNPGEELIYNHELTNHYLPNSNFAQRTKQND